MLKKVLVVFVTAFLTNYVWENLHASLYTNYKGGAITQFVLLHATVADALIILAMVLPFFYCAAFRKYAWTIIPIGFAVAIGTEWWALDTGRWAYTAAMPIVPLVHTGLTPTLQLGLLGYFSYWLAMRVGKKEV